MEYLELFTERVEKDRNYLDRLLLTLELNKIEKRYQDLNNPKIYNRELDDTGLTVSFSSHHFYKDKKLPLPKETFSEEDRNEILQYLSGEGILEKMEMMIVCGQLEQQLIEFFSIESPPFDKLYDEKGFVIAFKPRFNMGVGEEEAKKGEWIGAEQLSYIVKNMKFKRPTS